MGESDEAPRYFVDLEGAAERNRSLSRLIAERKCHECRQADTQESLLDSNTQEHIKRIAKQCAHTPEYLLPDTPLKEAIFRVILASGNQPTTAQEISEILSEQWGMTPNPRDLSPAVIQRLLDHSQTYCIAALPQPSAEEDSEA